MYKKAWYTCKVVVLRSKPIAFSTSWLPSPSSLLKRPNLSFKFDHVYMIGEVTLHMLPHLSGVPHLHGNSPKWSVVALLTKPDWLLFLTFIPITLVVDLRSSNTGNIFILHDCRTKLCISIWKVLLPEPPLDFNLSRISANFSIAQTKDTFACT